MPPSPQNPSDSDESSDDALLMGNSITGLFEGAMDGTAWSDQKLQWEPPDEEELKRLFPAHEIQCLLGRGGMGVVYKAFDTVLRKTVAIKLLPPALAGNAQLVARFKREAHVMNALDHPGIVKVHTFVQTGDGHAYFVMDYVEGKTIHELVAAKEISVRQTLRIIVQICKALHYLHGKGVIHRDIKPSNIIVDLHGNARLLDFGIAGQMPGGTENLTLTGQNPGTPFYMAPELQRGEPPTASSDIYALGVTFYEMLTGERPHIQTPPPSSRSAADSGIDKVVFRALKPQPGARFKNADEMRKAIESCSRAAREFRLALVLASVLVSATLATIAWVVVPKMPAVTGENPAVATDSLSDYRHTGRPPGPPQEPPPAASVPDAPPSAIAAPQKQLPLSSDFKDPPAGSTGELKLPGGTIMKFVYCPAGNFIMGSPSTEKNRDSALENQAPVNLSQGFWMAQTECTQGQWKAVMGESPRHFQGDNFPVFDISWLDSQAFIAKLSLSLDVPSGWRISLPTAAQWEYACRAGTTTTFHFGDSLNGTQANCVGIEPYGTDVKGPSLGRTSLVGSYSPNAWGLFDMHGNVREWTADWFGGKLEGGTDPQGQPTGEVHSFRGGGWGDDAWRCRAARSARCFGPGDDTRGTWYGFRIAMVPSHPDAISRLGDARSDFAVLSPSPIALPTPPIPESTTVESPPFTAAAEIKAANPLAEFTAVLHGHGWSYEDSLYPGSNEQPPSPMVFHPNGTFHEKWKWSYWIAAPGVLHVQFWDAVYKPETAVVLNFNEARTAYAGEFKDEKGRLHKLSGTRLAPIR